jgi:hypothetical protein
VWRLTSSLRSFKRSPASTNGLLSHLPSGLKLRSSTLQGAIMARELAKGNTSL